MTDGVCLACEIVSGRREPQGGVIVETEHWNAHQDVAYPVPGMVIVASRRHFLALDEASDAEAVELIRLVRRIRRAQREVLDVEHTYYFYNEDTSHHFHLWVMPRYDWMTRFGKSVDSVRPALRHSADHMADAASLAAVDDATDRLRRALAAES